MRWEKLGQLYCPEPLHPKLVSHAANPLPVLLEGDLYRVFYSGRDSLNRSSVGYVDIDIESRQVHYVHDSPVFEHGPTGSFYSHGVSIGNCYEANGKRYMLFMGWQNIPGKHWRGDIGRLVLEPDYSLHLENTKPLITINPTDQISLSYPWVILDDNHIYQMWYGSTVTWDGGNGEMVHVINHATSHDGNNWDLHGLALPYRIGVAQAFSRPTMLKDENGCHMWFSYRSGTGQTYRIGYATCQAGGQWQLKLDQAGIDVSPSGWDSEMIEYPFVFEHKGSRYMLYNGNGNGKTGFGLARMERDD